MTDAYKGINMRLLVELIQLSFGMRKPSKAILVSVSIPPEYPTSQVLVWACGL